MKELQVVIYKYEKDGKVLRDSFILEAELPSTKRGWDELEDKTDDLARFKCIQHDGKFLVIETVFHHSVED